MALRAQCNYCGHSYTLADKFEGKTVRCNECGKSFQVIALVEDSPSAAISVSKPKPPPVVKATAKKSAPARRERDDEDDYEDRAQRHRRRLDADDEDDEKGGGNTILWIAGGVGGAVVLGGIVLVVALMVSRGDDHGQVAQVVPVQVVPNPVVALADPNLVPVFPKPAPIAPKKADPIPIQPAPQPVFPPVQPPIVEPNPVAPKFMDEPVGADFRRKGAWKLEVDPGLEMPKMKATLKSTLPVLGLPHFASPTTPSPYLAVRQSQAGREGTQVVNLATYKQEGYVNAKLDLSDEILSPDGRFLVGKIRKGIDQTINVFSFADGRFVRPIPLTSKESSHAKYDFGPSNHLLLSTGGFLDDTKFKTINIATGAVVKEFTGADTRRVIGRAWVLSPGRRFLALGGPGRVSFYDVMKGKIVGEILLGKNVEKPAHMAFSPDGKEFALVCGKFGKGDRLVVFNTANADIVADHEFAGRLESLPGIRRTIELNFEWLPDGSGFWVGKAVWIDRVTGGVIYTTPEINGEEGESPRRIFGGDLHVLV